VTEAEDGADMAATLKELDCYWAPQEWLISYLRPLLEAITAYRQFVAIGLLFRHLLPESEEAHEAFITAEAEHDETSITRCVMGWVKDLDSDDIQDLCLHADTHLESLIRMLTRLNDTEWPDGELLALAISREWLEAVITLLRIRGEASSLIFRLQVFDRDVERLLPKEKPLISCDSPLLNSCCQRDGWWGRLAKAQPPAPIL